MRYRLSFLTGMVLLGIALGSTVAFWNASPVPPNASTPPGVEARWYEPEPGPSPGNRNTIGEQRVETEMVEATRVSVTPSPSPVPTPVPKPKATPVPRRHPARVLTGKASWFDTGRSGYYAAACAPLRKAMGPGWRGEYVLVSKGRKAIEVRLVDFCASKDKSIDLDAVAFRALAPLSRGVITVAIGW